MSTHIQVCLFGDMYISLCTLMPMRGTLGNVTEWNDWVTRLRRGDSTYRASQKTGVNAGSFSAWENGKGQPTIATIVAVARGYGASPIDGIIAAGYATPEEIQDWLTKTATDAALHDATNSELVRELERRLEASAPTDTISPVSELPTPDDEVRPANWDNLAAMTHYQDDDRH